MCRDSEVMCRDNELCPPVPYLPSPDAQTDLPSWPRLVAASLARTLLAMVAALLLWAGAPMILGWHTTTVLTGSMEPRLSVGDLAVSRPVPVTSLRVKEVILFPDPDHPGRLRLHRFVAADPDGRLITRGDANAGNDSTPIDASAVRGVGTLRVPYLGLPRVWVQERHWLRLGALVAIILALVGLTGFDRQPSRARTLEDGDPDQDDQTDQDEADQDQADQDQAVAAANRPKWAWARRRLLLVIGVPVLAAVLAATLITRAASYSAFSDTTGNPGNSLSAATYYRCSNAIADDGPRIWYRLDETSGSTAADSSGNNRGATYRGGFTLGSPRACSADTGSSVTFNGSSGYLSSTQAFTTPPTMTEEVWFKTGSTRGGLLIGFGNASTGSSGTADRQLYLTSSGRVSFSVLTGGTAKTITSPDSYNDNGWHHAAATLSSAGTMLYLDGERIATSNSATSGASYTGYVRVGYDNLKTWSDAPSSYYLAGSLDDAAVYNLALSAGNIASHYHAAG